MIKVNMVEKLDAYYCVRIRYKITTEFAENLIVSW